MGLARHALRLGPTASFAAGALILTATSDWLTASLVPLGYNLAILLHLVAALGLVRWARDARRGWLAVAIVAGTASLWTVDAAATVHPLTPLLALLACEDSASRRRLALASVAWLLCATPYYLELWRFLTNPDSYAAQAIVVSSWPARLARCAELVAFNFTPWRWAFGRRNWFLAPPSTVPMALGVVLAGLGLAVVGWMLARLHAGERWAAHLSRQAGPGAGGGLWSLDGAWVGARPSLGDSHGDDVRRARFDRRTRATGLFRELLPAASQRARIDRRRDTEALAGLRSAAPSTAS